MRVAINNIESLESRRLLSATLVAHTLYLRGTDSADTIAVNLNGGARNIQVAINSDSVRTFNQDNVHRIIVRSYAGDDVINIDSAVGKTAYIFSGAGGDTINCGDEKDIITSDGGNDVINAGAGNNIVDSGAGNDQITSFGGHDAIFAGKGNDTVTSGAGKDIINGDNGADRINSGAGDDRVYGGRGNDSIDGMAGDDRLWGQGGDDVIDAGEGNDKLGGIVGTNTLTGGAGNDAFFVKTSITTQTSDYDSSTDIIQSVDKE